MSQTARIAPDLLSATQIKGPTYTAAKTEQHAKSCLSSQWHSPLSPLALGTGQTASLELSPSKLEAQQGRKIQLGHCKSADAPHAADRAYSWLVLHFMYSPRTANSSL